MSESEQIPASEETALRGGAAMLLAEAAVVGVTSGAAEAVVGQLLNRPEPPPAPEPPQIELPPGVDRE